MLITFSIGGFSSPYLLMTRKGCSSGLSTSVYPFIYLYFLLNVSLIFIQYFLALFCMYGRYGFYMKGLTNNLLCLAFNGASIGCVGLLLTAHKIGTANYCKVFPFRTTFQKGRD